MGETMAEPEEPPSSVRDPVRPSRRVEMIAVPGLPDFAPGDDLAAAILAGIAGAGLALNDGDVVVVAQKIVSKCENAYVDLARLEPGASALELARTTGKDPRLVEAILQDTGEVLRARDGLMIVANRAGHVMANAGIDASNLPPEAAARVLRLPADPDGSAAALKTALERATSKRLAVIVNDSWGRAWRNGTTGHAVGVAGMPALWDRRGEPDMYGRTLRVTQIGLADEIAAAASLVMGAAAERQPVVVVRGLALPAGDGRSSDLVREKSKDLFR
jgi:coenzyme F420-0:L-glutamate ligase/coenzyme F420-1:gamma-L-glutamate ligase